MEEDYWTVPLHISSTKCWKCGTKEGLELWRTMTTVPYWKPCKVCGYKKKWIAPKERHMACPACSTALVSGKEESYETMSEHVMDVNGGPRPRRPTWKCPKKKCIVHKSGGFYSYSGSFYSGDVYIPVPSKYWYARFSIDDEIDRSIKKSMKKRDVKP